MCNKKALQMLKTNYFIFISMHIYFALGLLFSQASKIFLISIEFYLLFNILLLQNYHARKLFDEAGIPSAEFSHFDDINIDLVLFKIFM